MEREKSTDMEIENEGWEGIRRQGDVGSRKWKGEQESEGKKDDGSDIVCTQLSEVHDTQSSTELFNSSFNHDQQH